MIDQKTTNLELPLPHADNLFEEDVERLRSAFNLLDAAVADKQDALGYVPVNSASIGAPSGVAGLDSSGKVPAANLPSYVDDVVEFANFASLPATGETGKIYVLQSPHTIGNTTSSQFRWSGSAYVPIIASPGSTDAVPEGAANLYFTNQRARDAQLPATAASLGVIRVGSGLSVSADGLLSAVGGGGGGGVPSFNELVLTASVDGQSVFAPAGGYTVGTIELFLNGVLLVGNGADYTASDGANIILIVGVTTADTLLLRRWTTNTNLPFSSLVDKPTTKAGYGITDDGAPEKSVPVAASNLDLSQGTVFAKTISGATTFTVSNVPAAGSVASFLLDLTNGGSAVITWWAGIKWPAGVQPGLTAAGRDVLGFFSYDGGTTWTGLLLGRDVK